MISLFGLNTLMNRWVNKAAATLYKEFLNYYNHCNLTVKKYVFFSDVDGAALCPCHISLPDFPLPHLGLKVPGIAHHS